MSYNIYAKYSSMKNPISLESWRSSFRIACCQRTKENQNICDFYHFKTLFFLWSQTRTDCTIYAEIQIPFKFLESEVLNLKVSLYSCDDLEEEENSDQTFMSLSLPGLENESI